LPFAAADRCAGATASAGESGSSSVNMSAASLVQLEGDVVGEHAEEGVGADALLGWR
jgi:hypothetical protein